MMAMVLGGNDINDDGDDDYGDEPNRAMFAILTTGEQARQT